MCQMLLSTLILPIALRCGRRIPDNSQEMQETDREHNDLHGQRQSSLEKKRSKIQNWYKRGPKGSKSQHKGGPV